MTLEAKKKCDEEDQYLASVITFTGDGSTCTYAYLKINRLTFGPVKSFTTERNDSHLE